MKLNYKRTLLTGLAFMSICSFWSLYDNIVPLILKNSFSFGEIVTGFIMAADNILALFLLPLFGGMSDKCRFRMGKRMPFILGGTVLSLICMIFMPVADRLRNPVMFLIMTGLVLVSMGIYRSPAVALMPDVTPRPLRSKGNAVVNLTGTFGAIFALVMIKKLVGEGLTPDYMPLFLSVIAFMALCTVVLAFTVRENKWSLAAREIEKKNGVSEEEDSLSDGKKSCKNDSEKESVNVESNKTAQQEKKVKLAPDKKRSLILLLLSVAFWYMAYNAVTTAFSRYATEIWHLEGGGYADCLMISTVAAILSYIPLGYLAGHIGRKKSVLVGVVGLITGFLFVGTFSIYHSLINVGFVIIGVAWAAINVNSFPMVVEIANDSDVGKYTGYYYTFSMAAQVLTPVLSGALLQLVSYRTLFPYSVIFSILAFITMSGVRHGDCRPASKKSVLEGFDVGD